MRLMTATPRHAPVAIGAIAVVAIVALSLSTGPLAALTNASATCNIAFIEVPVSGPRLLVKCDAAAPGPGGARIEYFAVNLARETERAKLVLSVLMTAKVAARPVRMHYYLDDNSATGWDMGCNPADCRPILRVDLL